MRVLLLLLQPVGLAVSLGALVLCLNGTISNAVFLGIWAGSWIAAVIAAAP